MKTIKLKKKKITKKNTKKSRRSIKKNRGGKTIVENLPPKNLPPKNYDIFIDMFRYDYTCINILINDDTLRSTLRLTLTPIGIIKTHFEKLIDSNTTNKNKCYLLIKIIRNKVYNRLEQIENLKDTINIILSVLGYLLKQETKDIVITFPESIRYDNKTNDTETEDEIIVREKEEKMIKGIMNYIINIIKKTYPSPSTNIFLIYPVENAIILMYICLFIEKYNPKLYSLKNENENNIEQVKTNTLLNNELNIKESSPIKIVGTNDINQDPSLTPPNMPNTMNLINAINDDSPNITTSDLKRADSTQGLENWINIQSPVSKEIPPLIESEKKHDNVQQQQQQGYPKLNIVNWIPTVRKPTETLLVKPNIKSQTNIPSKYIKIYNYFKNENIHNILLAIKYKFISTNKPSNMNELTKNIYHALNTNNIHNQIISNIESKRIAIYSFIEGPIRFLFSVNYSNPLLKYEPWKKKYFLNTVSNFYNNTDRNIKYTIELDEILSIVYNFFKMYIENPLFVKIIQSNNIEIESV